MKGERKRGEPNCAHNPQAEPCVSNRVIKYVTCSLPKREPHPPIMPQSRPRLHQSALIKVLIDLAGLALQSDYWRVCLDDSITIKVLGWSERRSGCSFRLGPVRSRLHVPRRSECLALTVCWKGTRLMRARALLLTVAQLFLEEDLLLRLMGSTIIRWLTTFWLSKEEHFLKNICIIGSNVFIKARGN